MTNPFANIQPAQPGKPLQALSVSNVHSLSRITSVNGQLCPDYTKYLLFGSSIDSYKRTVNVFDASSNLPLEKIEIPSHCLEAQLSRDGSKLLAAGLIYDFISRRTMNLGSSKTICDWDFKFCYTLTMNLFSKTSFSCYNLSKGKGNIKREWSLNLKDFDGKFNSISPNGSFVAIKLENYGKEVFIVDTRKREIIHRLQIPGYGNRVKFSLDSLSLFTTGDEASFWLTGGGGDNISIWSISDGKCVYRDPNSHSIVSNLDSTLLFLAGNDGIIHIYDIKQWKEIHQIQLDYTNYIKEDTSLNDLYRSTLLDINSDGTKLLIQYAGGKEIWGVY